MGSTFAIFRFISEINLVKNVSKDKKLYVNQIPREVLDRIILTTTDKGDVVLDPMCGTGSAVVAAADLEVGVPKKHGRVRVEEGGEGVGKP